MSSQIDKAKKHFEDNKETIKETGDLLLKQEFDKRNDHHDDDTKAFLWKLRQSGTYQTQVLIKELNDKDLLRNICNERAIGKYAQSRLDYLNNKEQSLYSKLNLIIAIVGLIFIIATFYFTIK